MENCQGHICHEGYLPWMLSDLHFNSSVLSALRIAYFLQEAPAVSCFKEIEKKYIAFNSPQINPISNTYSWEPVSCASYVG